MMTINFKTVLITSAIFISGWVLSNKLEPNKSTEAAIVSINKSEETEPISPTPYRDKEFYQLFLESKGLSTNAEPIFADLTGNGKQAIFIAVGEGCGSCHYKEIHIFDNKKEVFTFYGDDVVLNPIIGLGFSITQPVRKDGEPYSSPSEYQSAIYLWDGKTFVKTKTSSNWIDEPQTPG